jgi:hypothetical protein
MSNNIADIADEFGITGDERKNFTEMAEELLSYQTVHPESAEAHMALFTAANAVKLPPGMTVEYEMTFHGECRVPHSHLNLKISKSAE